MIQHLALLCSDDHVGKAPVVARQMPVHDRAARQSCTDVRLRGDRTDLPCVPVRAWKLCHLLLLMRLLQLVHVHPKPGCLLQVWLYRNFHVRH